MGVTLHFQSTGTVPGTGAPVTMTGASLTIGRGGENDMCLPDPGKVISKVHCAIETRGDEIVVVDLSTNGTFLNYGKFPVGEVPAPLNDGDILTLGAYELLVEIVHARRATPTPAILPPEDGAPVEIDDIDSALQDAIDGGHDDFLDDLLGDTPLKGPSGIARDQPGDDGLLPPLGEDESGLLDPAPQDPGTGASRHDHGPSVNDAFAPRPAAQGDAALIPDDWEDDLLAPSPGGRDDPGDAAADPFAASVAPPVFIPEDDDDDDLLAPDLAPGPAPPEPEAPTDFPAPNVFAETDDAPAPTPRAAPQAPVPAPPPVALTAPAPAASAPPSDAARAFLSGLGADDLPITDAELPATMTRLGGVLQAMIHGLREILMTRADIKSEFRIQQTRIGAGGNNPLKFSISPEQAVEAMVKPTTKGYLDAGEATRQALDDIKAHEVAMMSAMDAALKGVLKQLSPEVLEGQITGSGGLSGLLKGKKARYWDVYEQMYARISDQAENDFHEVFSREFARAYQAQLERLK